MLSLFHVDEIGRIYSHLSQINGPFLINGYQWNYVTSDLVHQLCLKTKLNSWSKRSQNKLYIFWEVKYLSMRAMMFSEDMITTGILLNVEDVCWMVIKANITMSIIFFVYTSRWTRKKIFKYFIVWIYLTLIFLRSSYPVIPGIE